MIVMIIIVVLEIIAGLLAFAFWPEVTQFEADNLYYYTLKSQSLFRELQIILDILSRVEHGRIATGVICNVHCAVA